MLTGSTNTMDLNQADFSDVVDVNVFSNLYEWISVEYLQITLTGVFPCCEIKQIMPHVTTFQWPTLRTITSCLTQPDKSL